MPSAWTQHLSAYRASHPSKSMKECMIEASACYRKSGVVAASNAVKMATKKTSSSKKATYRGAAAISSSSNPWIAHVKAYRASHGCSYAEAMQGAKKTYPSYRSIDDPQYMKTEVSSSAEITLRIKSEYVTNGWPGLSLLTRCDKTQCGGDTYLDFNQNNELPITYQQNTYQIPMIAIKSIKKLKERYEGYSQEHMSLFD